MGDGGKDGGYGGDPDMKKKKQLRGQWCLLPTSHPIYHLAHCRLQPGMSYLNPWLLSRPK